MLRNLLNNCKKIIPDKKALSTSRATRHNISVQRILEILPDPDPILKKLGKTTEVFKELRKDPHIKACIGSRKAGVKSLELRVDKGNSSDKTVELVDEMFRLLPTHNIISQILDAPLEGFQVLEINWQYIKPYYIPVSIEAKPIEWFKFDGENKLKLITKENRKGEELLPYKFLLVQNEPSYENPYGDKILSSCFWPFIFKKGGLKFFFVFVEKYGMPVLIGKHPVADDKAKTEEFADTLENMVQDAIIIIPDNSSVEIQESPYRDSSAGMYKDMIETCNAELSKAILGQTLSTENTGTGSYAATKGHLEVRADIIDDDVKLVEQTLNQLVQWFCELNVNEQEYPEVKLYEEEKVDKTKAERDEILARTGVRFSKKYFEKNYSLEEEDFDVQSTDANNKKEFLEFAEKLVALQSGEQKSIDDFIDSFSTEEFQSQIEPVIEPVLKMIMQASSYEEALENLSEKYPEMDGKKLEDTLARTIFISELWGMINGKS